VTVSQNDRDRLRPTIKWLDVEIPRENMRLITFMPDESSPAGPFQRGVGPLQLCGAAVSVAVESTEWAANYFAGGGRPPLIIKAASELGTGPDADAAEEASILRTQWMDQDANTPRVIDPGIEDITFPPDNSQGGQMLDARNNENGNAARMFGIPGSLLEYQQSGSSLTYQNLEGEFTKFVRAGLAPGYLEPIEQELSDLLTRSTVARFAVSGFLRADAKTRAEVYNLLVPLGIITVEEARQTEGLDPGDIEFEPVPFSPPQAVPDRLPIQRVATAQEVRCDGTRLLKGLLKPCNAKLAEQGPFIGTCWRCGKQHGVEVRDEQPTQTEVFAALIEHLPVRIAAQMPAPVVNIAEGAVRVEVNTPPLTPMKRVIRRDPETKLALFSVEEPA
jgi:hypothetical protein